MESKVCVNCNTEKSIVNFCYQYSECKQCNIQRSLKCYYEKKDKISNQQKLYHEKKDVLLAKSKLIQQNRKYDRKICKQQINELNEKLEDLTQAIEMLKSPN